MLLHATGVGIVAAAVMALAAVAFTVQFGVTNIRNLAYGDVMATPAASAYMRKSARLNPWWLMVFDGPVRRQEMPRWGTSPLGR